MERKDTVLAFLKASGEASLEEVSRHLGVTKQGTLRHLEALRADGLVEVKSEDQHDRRGRPRHLYRLTQAAEGRFPTRHRELAVELVHFLDAEQLQRFFAERRVRVEAEYERRLAGKSGRARLEELARVATENGHMASVVELADGALALRQCNCPIGDVAAETRLPCRHEHDMYARLLGAEIERTSFMPESGATCTYVVKAAPAKAHRNKG